MAHTHIIAVLLQLVCRSGHEAKVPHNETSPALEQTGSRFSSERINTSNVVNRVFILEYSDWICDMNLCVCSLLQGYYNWLLILKAFPLDFNRERIFISFVETVECNLDILTTR